MEVINVHQIKEILTTKLTKESQIHGWPILIPKDMWMRDQSTFGVSKDVMEAGHPLSKLSQLQEI